MKNRVRDATRLLLAWLLSVTFSAQAFTLAELSGQVVIGRPLDVTVQIQPSAGEAVTVDCVTAEVLYADSRQTPVRVSVNPPNAMSAAAVLRVQVSAYVNEPVVTVVVQASCGSSTQRRYVLLADFPTAVNLALPTAPAVGTAQVLVLPPPTPAVVSVLADLSSKPAAKSVRTPKRSKLKPASSSSTSAPPQRSKTVARAAGKAVLKLDPLDIFSDRMDTLDAAMVFAPTEDTLLHSRKIAELEQDVNALRALAASFDAKLSDLRLQLQQAQANQMPVWVLPGMGLLLLLCLLVLGWLLWQQRRVKQEQDLSEWWNNHDLTTPLEPEAMDSSHVQTRPPEVKSVNVMETVAPVKAAPLPVLQKAFPSTVKEPVHRTIDIDLDDVLSAKQFDSSLETHTTSAPFESSRIRHISVEPILDIRQQAEFFVSLGQSDRAVSILKKQIATSTEPNPLVYLDLIALYHTLGMKADYLECAAQFNQLFNGIIADFADFNNQDGGLEDYPETLNQLVTLWPRNEALVFLNACIFNDPQVQPRQTFELTAFRDLLLLNAMADAMSETLTLQT